VTEPKRKVGRPRRWVTMTQVRFAEGEIERVRGALHEDEQLIDFLNAAIMREVARREKLKK
jgi:hypothetical protein